MSSGESGQPCGRPESGEPRSLPVPTGRASRSATRLLRRSSRTAAAKRAAAVAAGTVGKHSSTSVRSTHSSPACRPSTTACTASATPSPGR